MEGEGEAHAERERRVACEYKIISINELSYGASNARSQARERLLLSRAFLMSAPSMRVSCRTGLIAVGHFTVVDCNSLCCAARSVAPRCALLLCATKLLTLNLLEVAAIPVYAMQITRV